MGKKKKVLTPAQQADADKKVEQMNAQKEKMRKMLE